MNKISIDITTDNHVHTRLCNHARGEMEEYILSAVNKSLRKIVFLEHLETGIDYFESTWLSDADFEYYHSEGRRLQAKYKDTIAIGLGVEVGYNPDYPDQIQNTLSRFNWDTIGISYHFFKTREGHFNMVSGKQVNIDRLARYGIEEVIERYYRTLLEAVEKIPGNVLCHIDAVLRHHPEAGTIAAQSAVLDELLEALSYRDISLEINTSGYKMRDEPYPSPAIIRKALKRDISLVAGSDAHCPEDVGRYFDRLPGLLEELRYEP